MAQVIDKLAYIKIVDRKVLITRSRGIADTYYIPGGKREPGETDQQALIREVKEELDVDLLPDSLSYLGTFEAQAHGKPPGVMVRMTCYTGDYHGDIRPTSEVEEISWFQYRDKARTSPVDHLIFDWLRQNDHID